MYFLNHVHNFATFCIWLLSYCFSCLASTLQPPYCQIFRHENFSSRNYNCCSTFTKWNSSRWWIFYVVLIIKTWIPDANHYESFQTWIPLLWVVNQTSAKFANLCWNIQRDNDEVRNQKTKKFYYSNHFHSHVLVAYPFSASSGFSILDCLICSNGLNLCRSQFNSRSQPTVLFLKIFHAALLISAHYFIIKNWPCYLESVQSCYWWHHQRMYAIVDEFCISLII